MKKTKSSRLLSLLMAIAMAIGLLPLTAFAFNDNQVVGNGQEQAVTADAAKNTSNISDICAQATYPVAHEHDTNGALPGRTVDEKTGKAGDVTYAFSHADGDPITGSNIRSNQIVDLDYEADTDIDEPLEPGPGGAVIADEKVPLSSLPQIGAAMADAHPGMAMGALVLAAIMAAGGTACTVRRKKEEEAQQSTIYKKVRGGNGKTGSFYGSDFRSAKCHLAGDRYLDRYRPQGYLPKCAGAAEAH